MKLVEFQNNRYYVVDETADVYICSPYSQLEGYHTISKQLAIEIADFKDFYNHYESCWDYAYQNFDRGLLLTYFIDEKAPEWTKLFFVPKPNKFSEIPDGLRERFQEYLAAYAKENGIENFSDEVAAIMHYTDCANQSEENEKQRIIVTPSFRLMYFNVADGEIRYPGYTRGELWNGWACPRFTKEVGLQIAKDTAIEDYYLVFDEEHDRFVYHDCNYDQVEYETFEGEDIVVDTEVIHVYPIGAWSWIWTAYEHKYSRSVLEEMLTERCVEACDKIFSDIVTSLKITDNITPGQAYELKRTFSSLVTQYTDLIEQNGGLK